MSPVQENKNEGDKGEREKRTKQKEKFVLIVRRLDVLNPRNRFSENFLKMTRPKQIFEIEICSPLGTSQLIVRRLALSLSITTS